MTVAWLTLLWLLPAAGAVVAAALPRMARWTGSVTALGALAISVGLAVAFDPASGFQFVESRQWIPSFGAGYRLGLDGTALVLVLLTTALVPVLLLAQRERSAGYTALTLAVQSLVLLSFVTTDVLLFYLVFEAMLIPLYLLLNGFGGTGSERRVRTRAAVKFLLYNLAGGLVMLSAVIALYRVAGTFDLRVLLDGARPGPGTAQDLIFLGFMVAFAVKAPLWPLHTWLPGAAVQTTPPTAVLMMAVVDKVGTFAMLRYCLTLFPDAAARFAPWVAGLAVVGIVYGAILAIGQSDVMALIAYTSISHFGFIILGIFARTPDSQAGSVLYMVNHGVATAALFLTAGYLVARRGSRRIEDFGGVWSRAPRFGAVFLIAGLATLSLPGLGPFVSELLVVVGTYPRWAVAAIVAVTALVLSALYVLWTYQRMFTGPVSEPVERTVDDARGRELVVLVPLIVALLGLGVFPGPALDVIGPAVAPTTTEVTR
ncbi:NADH-quinone oxidoreductase subunit M [Tsukamurella serpentis]